jgi:Cu/Ag efflux pump CusA
VPLSSLVKVEPSSSPTTIRRYDRQNQILIGANVVGRNVNEVQQEIASRFAGASLPSGLRITFTGSTQQQQEGFNTLLIAMALSVLFVYMVLASQFGSFLQPLVIMLAMPFSFIGAFLALRLTGFVAPRLSGRMKASLSGFSSSWAAAPPRSPLPRGWSGASRPMRRGAASPRSRQFSRTSCRRCRPDCCW